MALDTQVIKAKFDANVEGLVRGARRVSRAVNDIGNNSDGLDRLSSKLTRLSKGFPLAIAGFAAIGAVGAPAIASLVIGVTALSVSLASAGAAVGVFGAVAKSAFTKVVELSKSQAEAQEKITEAIREYGAGSKEAIAAQAELNRLNAEAGPALGKATSAYNGMTSAWQNFVKANSPVTYGLITRGLNLITGAIPKLQPLFDIGAKAAGRLVGALERFASGGGVERIVAFFAKRAPAAIAGFIAIGASLGRSIGNIAVAFKGTEINAVQSLANMASAFERFTGTTGGFESFINYARENGPAAFATLKSVAQAIITLGQAAAPLAPVTLAIAQSLASIVNAIPQGVLTGLIAGFIAASVAIRLFNAGVKIFTVVSKVASVAITAFRQALFIFNLLLITNPIGLLIAGLVLLAAALVAAYFKFEGFRNVVNSVFSFLLNAGTATISFFASIPSRLGSIFSTIGSAIVTAFNAVVSFFQSLPGRIGAFLAALPGLFVAGLAAIAFAVGYGLGTIVKFYIELPGRIIRAVSAIGGLLKNVFVSAFNAVRGAVSSGISAVVSFFSQLPGRAVSAISGLPGRIRSTATTAMSGFRSAISSGASGAISFMSGLPGKLISALGNLGSALVGAGGDLVAGLARGIASAASGAVEAARRVAGQVVSGFKSALGINSPSRVLRDKVGVWIPAGIAAGITKNAGAVNKAMGGLAIADFYSSGYGNAGGFYGIGVDRPATNSSPVVNVVNRIDPNAPDAVKALYGMVAPYIRTDIDDALFNESVALRAGRGRN